jgi:glutamate carboxypeptidase
MKGCILSAIYAIEALLAMGYRSFGEIRFLCVSDEETTNRHCIDLIHQACQDCQGALVLEAARANGDIVSARKGNARYTLTARGRAAHAGVEPEKGRNAIVEIAHQTLQFQSLNGWREGITINPGVISGGILANVVPDFAQVQFDIRFLHPQDSIDLEKQWQAMMQRQRVPGVELTLDCEPDFKAPMVCTAASLKLVQMAQDIASLLGFSVNHVLTGGSSDGSYTSSYGVPTLDGLGPIGGMDHSPDEYLVANSIAPRTALLAGLIASIGA